MSWLQLFPLRHSFLPFLLSSSQPHFHIVPFYCFDAFLSGNAKQEVAVELSMSAVVVAVMGSSLVAVEAVVGAVAEVEVVAVSLPAVAAEAVEVVVVSSLVVGFSPALAVVVDAASTTAAVKRTMPVVSETKTPFLQEHSVVA